LEASDLIHPTTSLVKLREGLAQIVSHGENLEEGKRTHILDKGVRFG
jgi:hypothetical protein